MNHKVFLFALGLVMALAMPQSVEAQTFTSVAPSGQTLYYTISGGNAMVTYENSTVPRYTSLSGNLVIPDSVTNEGNTYAVTKINSAAFHGCSGITSVTIPHTIVSIGVSAFYNCDSLSTVNFNADSIINALSNVFYDCESLNTVNIGANVKCIPANAFAGCSSLTNIEFPPSVVRIGNIAFSGCTGLTSITLPQGLRNIGNAAFRNCTTLTTVNFNADSCIQMGGTGANAVFYGCSNLTQVTIGANVRCIPNNAFYGCTGITSITLPQVLVVIGNNAFNGCTGLTTITLPHLLTRVGTAAFRNCTGLATVNYNVDSCTNIWGTGTAAVFAGCSALTTMNIGNSCRYIPANFCANLASLTNLTMGDSVKTIDSCAFNSTGLTEVTLPASLTSLGKRSFGACYSLATLNFNCTSYYEYVITGITTVQLSNHPFTGCNALATVNFGNGVQNIPGYLCISKRNLTSVNISSSVRSIGQYAFRECTGLRSVTIPDSVTSIGYSAFENVRHIDYYGSAYGATWGALSMNGFVENGFVYRDSSKTYLQQYIGNDTSVIIPNSVINIGDSAFYFRSDITSVTIGNSVTSIGNYAFYNCSSLTSVTLPDSLSVINARTFFGCSSLTSVTIPNSVTSIGNYAFYNCSSLTSVTIGSSVTAIGSFAFSGCGSLTRTNYTGSIAQWCGIIFMSNPISISHNLYINDTLVTDLVIPDGVTSISGSAFSGCSSLTSVTIPNSVTLIDYGAFASCSGMISLSIGNSVTSIGGYAFSGCSSLTSVAIPNSVTSIGSSAFYGCSSLASVTLPDSLSVINSYTFYGCSSLTSVAIPNSVTSIGDYAFYNCSGLTSVTIGNSVTSVGNSAFYGCSSLTSVAFPNSVTSIEEYAFYGCSSLVSVTLPDSLSVINSYTFYGCSSLTSLTIPNSVTSIVNYAFQNCTNLTTVTIGRSVSSMEFAFEGCSNITSMTLLPTVPPIIGGYYGGLPLSCIFYIPCGTESIYQSSWGSFFNFYPLSPEIDFTLTVNNPAYGSATIVPQNGSDIQCDSTVTIKAIGNGGCLFVRWSNGRTANPDRLHLVGDSSVMAIFSLPYTVTTTTADTDTLYGETSGNVVHAFGDTVWLGAYAKMHCRFVGWSDGNTDNPRMYVVTSDTSFTAHFAPRDTVYEYYAPVEIHDTTWMTDTVYINGTATSNDAGMVQGEETQQYNGAKTGSHGGMFVNNDRTFIPDGPNCPNLGPSLLIGNMVSGFPDGAVIQSPEDIMSVCINMEHSFLGDLRIELLCPSYDSLDSTGQGLAVLKYKDTVGVGIPLPNGTFGGGGFFLGVPYGGINHNNYDHMNGNNCDSTENPYGLGFDYCFSRNRTRTLVNGDPANTPFPDSAGLAIAHRVGVTYTFPPIPDGFYSVGISCGTVSVTNVLPASNREEGTGFYVPASDFTSLVGCPFNGEWKLQIKDYLSMDNGWVFNWSIDFGSDLVVSSQDTALGSVGGSGVTATNANTQVTAMPKAGNYFLGWSDGSEENPYTLTVNGDTTVVAYFAERDSLVIYDTVDTLYIHDTLWIHDTIYLGIGGVDVLAAKVYQYNGQIVVEGAEGNMVTLYDAVGRLIATRRDDLTVQRFDIPVTGTYLVKIGNHPARKVVVIR